MNKLRSLLLKNYYLTLIISLIILPLAMVFSCIQAVIDVFRYSSKDDYYVSREKYEELKESYSKKNNV
jgi:hypothetical protein